MTLKFRISEPFDVLFSMQVNVTQDGIFTCTFPENISKLFEGKIELNIARRGGRPGYFESKTYEGLKDLVKAKITELCSETEIAREKIIRFGIETACAYALDSKGVAWPNAVGHDRKWVDGTVDRNANQKGAFGLRFYAMPLEKVTYQFAATGKTRIVYTGLGVHTFDPKAQEDPIQWLSDINSISSDDIETQEMPYTEEAALFFIGLYKWLFAVNENIKPYLNPKGIAQLATLGRGLFITEGDKAQAGEKGKTE